MSAVTEKKVGLGILAGISTGVFWGIPFLVPQMLGNYSSLEISFGRFFFFGIVSLIFIKKVWTILQKLSVKDRFILFLLSASGFWFYSTILFWGVQATDGIISSLILGLLPISIPLLSPGRKNSGPKFYLGLFLLLIGIVNLFAFPVLQGLKMVKDPSVSGILALLSCLCLWTWYAINNTRFLQRNPQINRKDVASVVGVISLFSILPIFLAQVNLGEFVQREDFSLYLVSSFALGFGSSWLANWLWNICSFHCPSEISGPLIISETIFGLLYSFFYQHRLPHIYESVSFGLFLVGVFVTVRSQMTISKSS